MINIIPVSLFFIHLFLFHYYLPCKLVNYIKNKLTGFGKHEYEIKLDKINEKNLNRVDSERQC